MCASRPSARRCRTARSHASRTASDGSWRRPRSSSPTSAPAAHSVVGVFRVGIHSKTPSRWRRLNPTPTLAASKRGKGARPRSFFFYLVCSCDVKRGHGDGPIVGFVNVLNLWRRLARRPRWKTQWRPATVWPSGAERHWLPRLTPTDPQGRNEEDEGEQGNTLIEH